MTMTFVEKVLAGDEFADRIDDYVAQWHNSPRRMALHTFLGLSRDEYGMWVEQPASLQTILFARRNGAPLESFEWDNAHLLAARSQSQQDPKILLGWLNKKGLL